jgi:hypothetical protein
MGPVLNQQTPATFSSFGWMPFCFRAGKLGYRDSDVKCLPGGNENQSAHFILESVSASASPAVSSNSDVAVKPAKAAAPVVEKSANANWKINKLVDSMSDAVTCIAYYRDNKAIQLTAGSLAISYRGRGGVSMGTWRIDDNAPLQRLATDTEKSVGAFFWEGSELARVLSGSRLRVQMFTILSTIQQDDLDTTGIATVWQALREGRC